MQKNLKKIGTILNKLLGYYIIFYIAVAFLVFVIPVDVLDKSEICLNFVNFMKQIFPNIEAFESVSTIPQLTAFFTSFMWIWGIGLAILFITLPLVAIFGIFINDKTLNIFFSFFAIVFFLVLGYLVIRDYYFGNYAMKVMHSGVREFKIYFNTKFDIFWWITLFQLFFAVACFFLSAAITLIVNILYFVKKI